MGLVIEDEQRSESRQDFWLFAICQVLDDSRNGLALYLNDDNAPESCPLHKLLIKRRFATMQLWKLYLFIGSLLFP